MEAKDQLLIGDQLEKQCLDYLDTLKKQPNVDPRWLAIARTDIEKGFMASMRAIAENLA